MLRDPKEASMSVNPLLLKFLPAALPPIGACSRSIAIIRSAGITREAPRSNRATTAVCYSRPYLLVLSEDYALLLGTLAVFGLLAGIMVGTRTLDWYRLAASRRDGV